MSKVFGYIYLVRNQVNGEVYIGQTVQSIETRWVQHCSKTKNQARSALHNAIAKYGKDKFNIVELGRAYSHEELDEMERRAIWSHNSTDRHIGYNITAGGGGIKGYAAPDHVREKVSQSSKALWSKPGFRESQRAKRKEKAQTNEWKSTHLAAMRLFARDEEYRAKHRANSKAMWDGPEYRARHKAAMAVAVNKDEYRDKQSADSRKRWADPEFRARMAEKRRLQWSDPEFKERVLAKRRKAMEDKAKGESN